jgi:hypothetical protein
MAAPGRARSRRGRRSAAISTHSICGDASGVRHALVAVDGGSVCGSATPPCRRCGLREYRGRLESLSPLRVLREATPSPSSDGTVIRDADTFTGQPIAVRVERGQIDCTVADDDRESTNLES